MRRGSGNLELIAFQIVGDGAGAIVRTGDYTNQADSDVSETALLHLEPGRILATTCITRSCDWPSNHLLLTTYSVRDPVATPAPSDILSIRYQNPPLPDPGDNTWAANGGDEYPLDNDLEWVQALSHPDEYEGSHLVGCTGWVVDPDDSGADVPFDHPMGFDWEFQIAVDDGEAGITSHSSAPPTRTPKGAHPSSQRHLESPYGEASSVSSGTSLCCRQASGRASITATVWPRTGVGSSIRATTSVATGIPRSILHCLSRREACRRAEKASSPAHCSCRGRTSSGRRTPRTSRTCTTMVSTTTAGSSRTSCRSSGASSFSARGRSRRTRRSSPSRSRARTACTSSSSRRVRAPRGASASQFRSSSRSDTGATCESRRRPGTRSTS